MSTHDLDQLRRWLHAIPDTAARTERRLADLHSLAFDRHVGESVGHARRTDWALDDVGQRAAKELWRRTARATHAALVELEAVSQAINKFLNGGDPTDSDLRGTMLGGEDVSASEELAALVHRQDARRQRGDYTPAREMAQPKVPRR